MVLKFQLLLRHDCWLENDIYRDGVYLEDDNMVNFNS